MKTDKKIIDLLIKNHAKYKKITKLHFEEAVHVTTNWRSYSKSYVTLCERFFTQYKNKLW
tara:strand:- start:10 stop:189 length:180 start_codon:yes stop_codon:yes gene_type:complete